MAVSKNELQVQWSSSNSTSVASGGNATSDVATFDATTFTASIQLKADNDGTPASGDTVDFYILFTTGDPDGTGSDEYDTTGAAHFLTQLDTNSEDPQIKTIGPIIVPKACKIYAENNSGGRAITVSAAIYEIQA